MKLVTKRLILRPLRISDAKDIVEGLNNLNITKWLSVVGHPYTLKDAKSWIKHVQLEFRKIKNKEYPFGIELKSEKKIIGGISLDIEDHKARLGYWINEKYWKGGYGSEALKMILNFAFKNLKLERVEAGVFVGNTSSRRLLEKFYFNKEGLKERSVRCKADGKIKDEYIYGLLRRKYKK